MVLNGPVMDKPYMMINGLNIIDYIAEIKWSSNDLDGPEAGRTLDTIMHRDKLGEKARFDIKLIPIPANLAIQIMAVLKNPEFDCVTNLIVSDANMSPSSFRMYNSTRSGSAHVQRVMSNGEIKFGIMYSDMSFNIIQK